MHVKKGAIEERKQLETTRVTPTCKATVVLRLFSSPKVMVVSIVILNEAKHETWFLLYFSLCYFNSSNCCSLFSTTFAQRLLLLPNAILGAGPYTTTLLVLVPDRKKKLLKQYSLCSWRDFVRVCFVLVPRMCSKKKRNKNIQAITLQTFLQTLLQTTHA